MNRLQDSEIPLPVTNPEVLAPKSGRSDEDKKENFALIVCGVYFLFAIIGVLHHEMWRDEFQSWMIAKSSDSIIDLFRNLRYEGSPPLWHLCLYAITRFQNDFFAMQLFNAVVSTCGSFLIARYAPFNRMQKVLFIFGYFSLFEYGIISRCYALGNLFLFGFCAALGLKLRWKNFILLGSLALASSTSLFGAIIAFALALPLVLDRCLGRRKETSVAGLDNQASPAGSNKLFFTGALMLAAVGAIVLAQVFPPADGFKGDWYLWTNLLQHDPSWARLSLAISSILVGYIPLPDPAYGWEFWDTSVFSSTYGQGLYMTVATMLFLFFSISFKDKRPALLSYLVGTAAMVSFFYLILMGNVRHYGQLFILLTCCLWISSYSHSSRVPGTKLFDKLATCCSKAASSVFSLILVFQLAASAFAFYTDYVDVFSETTTLAKYLKSTHRDKAFIAVIPDCLGVGLAATLNRSVYALGAGRQTTFTSWGVRKDMSDHCVVLAEVEQVMRRKHLTEMLLVIDGKLWDSAIASRPDLEILLLDEFKWCIVKHEEQFLYLIKHRPMGR